MSDERLSIDEVYDRLRRIATSYLQRERLDHTLEPTALVHEAWLRLARYRVDHALDDTEVQMLASHVMRRVLTDSARRRARHKRDAARTVSLEGVAEIDVQGPTCVVDVDEALTALTEVDSELAQVVELRFFGGHTLAEIATLTDCSLRTVNRRWQLARAWLLDAMEDSSDDT